MYANTYWSKFSDKNFKYKGGDTPLNQAARKGHLDVCRYIMQQSSDKNHKTEDSNTLLHLTAIN